MIGETSVHCRHWKGPGEAEEWGEREPDMEIIVHAGTAGNSR